MLFKMDKITGVMTKTLSLKRVRPYFLANGDHLYGIINNTKQIDIYNLDFELISSVFYKEDFDKVFFTPDEESLILLKPDMEELLRI